jgi:hypothetical protein
MLNESPAPGAAVTKLNKKLPLALPSLNKIF